MSVMAVILLISANFPDDFWQFDKGKWSNKIDNMFIKAAKYDEAINCGKISA